MQGKGNTIFVVIDILHNSVPQISQSFVKMVSELANTIGVSICVEGVETEEQYHILQGMTVRLVQGYYFDRPMPKADFEKKYV